MFVEWNFLLAEIWTLLVAAGFVGLGAGYLMFGGGSAAPAMAGAGPAVAPPPAAPRAKAETGGKQPVLFDSPQGEADDLKRIFGIDARAEQICNMQGIWHYKQIAKWTAEEVKWAEANLPGMAGRVGRDDWIAQSKTLAAGKLTDFARDYDAAQNTE